MGGRLRENRFEVKPDLSVLPETKKSEMRFFKLQLNVVLKKMESKMKSSLMIISAAACFSAALAGEPAKFYVNDELKRDIVTFTSKAPLETVVGKTGEIAGFIEVDTGDITGTAKAAFEVDLASLKTGIGMRDGHMRDQYLEVEKYPKAVFVLKQVKNAGSNAFQNNSPVELTLLGDFTVHGVTKEIEIPATAIYMKESEDTRVRLPGDLLHVTATFDVYLSDHNIKRPQFVILKLDDRQRIDLDFFASTAVPPVLVMKAGDENKIE
jgi:polyisoprenoid-binding protein YceI